MDTARIEDGIRKIEEFIYDQDKILTIPYISRKLDLSVHDSRILIDQYLEKCKNKSLGIHYLLSGKLKNENGFAMILSNSADLSQNKNRFELLSSELVYSVQAKEVIDINALQLAYPSIGEKALKGSIVGKNCVKIGVVNGGTITKSDEPPQKKRKMSPTKSVEKVVSNIKDNAPQMKEDDKEPSKDKKKSPQNSNSSKSTSKKGPVQPSKGISNFFNKLSEKPKIPPKENDKCKNIKVIDSDEESESKSDKELRNKVNVQETARQITESVPKSEKKINVKETAETSKSQKKAEQVAKKSEKRSRNDKSPSKQLKKRKRVIVQEDSDSDDMFAKESDMDSDTHEPSPEREPEPVVIVTEKPRSKRTKLVEKSFVDDEGYLVTKKEWVAMSGSENEEENKEQRSDKANASKKDSPKKKNISPPAAPVSKAKAKATKEAKKMANQKTITSFFTRK